MSQTFFNIPATVVYTTVRPVSGLTDNLKESSVGIQQLLFTLLKW